MKNQIRILFLVLTVSLAVLTGVPISTARAQGTAFTYQGELTSSTGPVTGLYDFQFAVFDSASGGTQIGSTIVTNGVQVANGLFVVTLDFGANVFTGNARWLDLAAHTNQSPNAFASMTPRQQLTPTPYAVLAGNLSPSAQVNIAGVTIQQNAYGAPNVVEGSTINSVRSGVLGATIGGGGATNYDGGDYNTTAVETNKVTADFGTVSGGGGNISSGQYATVGGGYNNIAKVDLATVGGGYQNSATGGGATIGGGFSNTASDYYSTVGGGALNAATGEDSTVGGGTYNQANIGPSTVAGGNNNIASLSSAIGGGEFNTATNFYATVPGGHYNIAAGYASFAAGQQAQATNNGAFVWADSQNAPFASTNDDSFNVRARGGVNFVTSGAGVTVDGVPFSGSGSGTISGVIVQQNPGTGAPNLIEGSSANFVSGGVIGATIGGGGATNDSGLAFTNSVIGNYGTVGGGRQNIAGESATVGGGLFNIATNGDSTVGGGTANTASGISSTVSGGGGNRALALFATVGGGNNNIASGSGATIPGGANNMATGVYSFAAGQMAHATNLGSFVWADSQFATFASTNDDSFNVRAQGGVYLLTGTNGLVVNGVTIAGTSGNNTASGQYASVAGGFDNQALSQGDFVGGGLANSNNAVYATIAGGTQNIAKGIGSTIAGGEFNETITKFSGYGAIGGGVSNSVGDFSTVGGGNNNEALNEGTIGGGDSNTAVGDDSTVPGGRLNYAYGSYSFAAGQQAQAMNEGAFVWADSQNTAFASTAADQFLVRAQGGFGIDTASTPDGSFSINTNTYLFSHAIYLRGETGSDYNHGLAYNGHTITNFGTGQYQVDGPALWGFGGGVLGTRNGSDHAALTWDTASVTVNGTFNNNSDRNAKRDFTQVTPAKILEKVTSLPITEWAYNVDSATRHIGPMAQDFYSAFNVGTDEKHIAPIDEGGVALAAIQGLNEKLNDKDALIQKQATEISDLKARLDALEKLVRGRN